MGELCDMNDLDRFLRSKEGKAHLDEIRAMLQGRTIRGVEFLNEVHSIVTLLHLNDGESFAVFQPSMKIEVIREQFADVIDREYHTDFPGRDHGKTP